MKQAVTLGLVGVGIVLSAMAFRSYNTASDQASLDESVCRLSGADDCDAAIDWTGPGTFVIAAIVVFGAAWLFGRSGATQSAEDLVS